MAITLQTKQGNPPLPKSQTESEKSRSIFFSLFHRNRTEEKKPEKPPREDSERQSIESFPATRRAVGVVGIMFIGAGGTFLANFVKTMASTDVIVAFGLFVVGVVTLLASGEINKIVDALSSNAQD